MSRILPPWAVRSLKSSVILKQNGLCVLSRNLSTALRPGVHTLPSCGSRRRVTQPPALRRSISTSNSEDFIPTSAEPISELSDEEEFPPQLCPPENFDHNDEFDSDRYVLLPVGRISREPTKANTGWRAYGKIWLRDNCQCSQCLHPDTRQRIVDIFSIPVDFVATKIRRTPDSLQVEWSDGHIGKYPFKWLATHTRQRRKHHILAPGNIHFRPFGTHTPGNNEYPTVSYGDVMANDKGLLSWLEHIYDWGFCFVKDTPVDPESTEALLKRIAFIRHTHYGGFWDFTADLTFKDTAYTTEFLGAHTDNTYFTDPARLQLFHLLSHTEGEGGASLLVDGFQAAKTLANENPEHARLLQAIRQPFHASGNADVCIQPMCEHPVFKLYSEPWGRLYQIRWNNYDRAPKFNWTIGDQEKWYEAAGHFNEIIQRPDMEIWTQLQPGTALIFDNWRMLHGRSEFTGKRRMCGGYINNDDFLSRYRMLKFGRERMLQHLGDYYKTASNPNTYF